MHRRTSHPSSASVQLRNALARFIAENFDLPEFYRLGWTRLGTGGNQSHFLPVIAEGALEGAPVIAILINYSKRAGHHAISAAIADIRLNVNSAKLGAHNCAGWASF